MKRITVVEAAAKPIFQAVLLGSLFVLFAGHNRPGGGFVGGLLAGAAVTIRYVAGGVDEVRSLTRFQPWTYLGAGLLLAFTTASVPMLLGEPLMKAGFVHLDVPLVGTVTPTTTLLFDLGVYLVVLGMVFMVFEAFGDDPDEEET